MLQFAFLALLPSSFPKTFPCFLSSLNGFLLFFPSLSLSACLCSRFFHEADQVRTTQPYWCPVNKHISILHQRVLSDTWSHLYPHSPLIWTQLHECLWGENVDASYKLDCFKHPSDLIHSLSSTWHTTNTQQTRHNLKFTRSHGRVLCECECLETFLWE